jgi:hypothetical protein
MEKIKRLREILKDVEFVYAFKRNSLGKFPTFIDLVEKHIKRLDRGREIKEFDQNLPKELVKAVVNVTLEKRTTPLLKEFYELFSFIVFNWNENVMKDDAIRKSMQYVDRFASDKMGMDELQNVLMETARSLRSQLVPGMETSQVSVHYWNIVKKENEKCPSVGQV